MREFRHAAERFRDRAGDERDLYRSEGEARALLNSAARIDNYVSRVRLDSRTRSDWQQIRSDLRAVANIYNLRFDSYGNNGGYGNWPERGRERERQRRNNGTWRWPF